MARNSSANRPASDFSMSREGDAEDARAELPLPGWVKGGDEGFCPRYSEGGGLEWVRWKRQPDAPATTADVETVIGRCLRELAAIGGMQSLQIIFVRHNGSWGWHMLYPGLKVDATEVGEPFTNPMVWIQRAVDSPLHLGARSPESGEPHIIFQDVVVTRSTGRVCRYRIASMRCLASPEGSYPQGSPYRGKPDHAYETSIGSMAERSLGQPVNPLDPSTRAERRSRSGLRDAEISRASTVIEYPEGYYEDRGEKTVSQRRGVEQRGIAQRHIVTEQIRTRATGQLTTVPGEVRRVILSGQSLLSSSSDKPEFSGIHAFSMIEANTPTTAVTPWARNMLINAKPRTAMSMLAALGLEKLGAFFQQTSNWF